MSRFSHLEFNQPLEEEFHESIPGSLDPGRWLAEADAAFRSGDFERALRRYAQMLEEEPLCVPAWIGQAQMLIELDEHEEARLWAEKGLERLPAEPGLMAARAVALARLGDTEGARVFSDNAAEARGESPYVWLARGEVLLIRRETPSDYCFDRAVTLGGGDWLWPWLVARALHFHGRFAAALKRTQAALAVAPAEPVVWLQLALCQDGMGLGAHAAHSLAQARELSPRCPELDRVTRRLADAGGWSRLKRRVRGWLGAGTS
ncbi:MAG: tetratricopeptide repeat protein [Verrucomicrobiales bacterium]|nr:tetratricopeptide repeat protein [Verrucomicrobiales bacterium]